MNLRDLLNGGTPSAPLVTAAPAAPVTPAATAAAALQPSGNPAQDLANILAAFESNAGAAPRVNPPEAAKVLATKTAAEVQGVPEPEVEEGPVVEAPTVKPADVLAAEAVPKSRRTAAVVQQELDNLLELHNKLSAEYEALKGEVAGYAATVRAEFAAEAEIGKQDLAKAYARAEELETELALQKTLNARAVDAIKQLQARAPAEGASCPVPPPLDELPSMQLAKALTAQGWTVTLGVVPA